MNESSLSPLQRDFLRPQKNENWFFPPWSIYLQTSFLSRKIMKAFQLQCLCLTCSEKESKFSNQRGSGLHGCTCTSSMQKMHIFLYHPSSCCNSHTLGNTEVGIPCHKMEQDLSGQVFLTFPIVYRLIRESGNPGGKHNKWSLSPFVHHVPHRVTSI